MQSIGIDMAKDTFYAAFDERTVMKFANTPAGIEEFMGSPRETDEARDFSGVGLWK
jgi:hypothetical protein